MTSLARHRTKFFFLIMITVLTGTFLAIKYAQGYRIDFIKKTIKPTGLLVATSNPNGAQVFVDSLLTTATDNTTTLPPGEHDIEIKKDGFYDWSKHLLIEKELVTQASAFLFPKIPDFKPITYSEILNPLLSPDGTNISYTIPLPNLEAGLWILALDDSPFGFSKQPRQIAKSQTYWDFSKANIYWSPDSTELLVSFSSSGNYLLSVNQLNEVASLVNITSQLDEISVRWEKIKSTKNTAKLSRLPPELNEILATSSAGLTFSPDSTKLLYLATGSANIPSNLIPPVIASSTQKENRNLKPNTLYVYDIKEDKNFEISNFQVIISTPTPTPKLKKPVTPAPQYPISNIQYPIPLWFPTSHHLIWINSDNKIVACEYDNTNYTTIYSGPLIPPYLFPTQGTGRLLILAQTDLQTTPKPNLYEVLLR